MRLKIDFEPDLVAMLQEEVKAGERAVKAAMAEAGGELKQAWRRQITSTGLGHRLPRTVRNRTYPKQGDSLDAAAFVWSNAPRSSRPMTAAC